MIKTVTYPRAALIGNPSDGYHGKTIAFVFKNFSAVAELTASEELKIIPCNRDRIAFNNLDELANEVTEFGYYGGTRLVKATIKVFKQYVNQQGITIRDQNFTIGYISNIPHRLGLAGSSAIVTSVFKAIMQFYEIDIPKPILANLILSVEKDELKIGAGLQDRVAQVYGCPVYMNFDKQLMEQQGYGNYTPFDKTFLPPLYLAYRTNLSEGSEITHNDLGTRFAKGDSTVIEAMKEWKELTDHAWKLLQQGQGDISPLLNRNFDIRQNICNISSGNLELVKTARAAGVSAKFTGSGGAIIGTYPNNETFEQLQTAMSKINATVIKPDIA